MRLRVHVPSNTVSANFGYNANTFFARQLLNRCANIAKVRAISNYGNAGVSAAACNVDDTRGLRAYIADEKHRTRIAVVAVYVRGDVEINDVARFQGLPGAWNAVTHHLVSTRADSSGKSPVAELAWVAASARCILTNEPIDFCRRHAGPKLQAHTRQCFCGHASGAPHALNLRRAEDLDGHRGFVA
jgi:hypothetical protein